MASILQLEWSYRQRTHLREARFLVRAHVVAQDMPVLAAGGIRRSCGGYGDTRRAGKHEGRLCEPTLNSAPAAAPVGPVWDPAHERHLVPYQQPYSLPVHQTVILVHCCSTDMLKARPLSDLLSHTLDPSIESAMYGTSVSERRRTSDEDSSQLTAHSLFTKTGSLLAQASNPSDQRRSRVIAALAASIWSSSDSIDSAEDEVDATKGSDYICVPLEVRSSVRLSLRGHSRVETT